MKIVATSSTLALLGGKPVRTKPFPAYNTIGPEEIEAVRAVMESGVLSKFRANWCADFYGGPQVRAFESEWAEACQAEYAVAVNSATSGLIAACGAAGLGRGDEVIVTPYSMICSASAPMWYGATPVFADIDPKTYCLDPESIAEHITARTKAIIVVHLFGQAADMDPIMEIAGNHGLVVIEDCAQAPFAIYKGRPVGTLGDMGVFSFNFRKHIHTGEGGVVTTNNRTHWDCLCLVRNHAEAVVGRDGAPRHPSLLGGNFRMGEIEAAIGRCQLKKAPDLIPDRQNNVIYLENGLCGILGFSMPHRAVGHSHVYYLHALHYYEEETGIPRALFVKALKAELPATEMREDVGPLIGEGYIRPVYMEPIFGQKTGLCPNAEKAHRTVITHELMTPPMTEADLDDVADAFHKVAENLPALRERLI